jgi:hypothetical protein
LEKLLGIQIAEQQPAGKLESEGVEFLPDGIVNMAKCFGWSVIMSRAEY